MISRLARAAVPPSAMFRPVSTPVREEQCIYRSGRHDLYGMVYWPTVAEPRVPIVICPPDGEERTWSLRPLVHTARALAAEGHPVLRFDFMGQGESDDDFEEASVGSRVEDLCASVDLFERLTGSSASVVGVRFSAAIVAQALATRPGARFMILWEPVLDPASYVQQL